jgi:KDO2-lipid IV(A) lauroyltransferase
LARLIFASALDRQARRHAWLRTALFAVEGFVMQLFWWMFRALSPERAAAIGRATVGVLGPRSPKAQLVKDNLHIAFPALDAPAIDRLALQTWHSMGLVFGEYPHLDRIARDPQRLTIDDRVGLNAYVRRERQAIFFGAHLSNWEIMALALAREGVPLLALHAPLTHPHFDKLLNRARVQLGCTMLARGESMRGLLTQLRDKGSIGLLLDLSMDDGEPVEFFGHPMSTSLTPARLALRYGCDIVPMRTQRVAPARFHVTAYPAVSLDGDAADEHARVLTISRRLTALMEEWIREEPWEWMCANRRWEKSLHRSLRAARAGRQ